MNYIRNCLNICFDRTVLTYELYERQLAYTREYLYIMYLVDNRQQQQQSHAHTYKYTKKNQTYRHTSK